MVEYGLGSVYTPLHTLYTMGMGIPLDEAEQANTQAYSHITLRTMSKLALLSQIPTLSVVSLLSSFRHSRKVEHNKLTCSGRKRRAKPPFHHPPELGQEELYPRICFCQLSRSPQELGFGMSLLCHVVTDTDWIGQELYYAQIQCSPCYWSQLLCSFHHAQRVS
jgi:hypothetical protein